MKTKFYWFALLASAAMIAQANAGGHHGGGGGGFGGSPNFGAAPSRGGGGGRGGFAPAGLAPARGGGVASYYSAPGQSFGPGRMIYSGRQFSPMGMRQFNSGNFSRSNGVARYGNNWRVMQGRNNFVEQNRAIVNRTNGTSYGNKSRVMQDRNNFVRRNGAIANRANGSSQFRNGNNLRSNWRSHVFAQHSGNWHRDWDRSRDHWWHGHRCHFFNGSWVIFDLGFYPWWSDWYPYDYYGYGYPSPYSYDSGYYDSNTYEDQGYYDQNGYGDQYVDQTVAAAQERLAREGYYRGQIDGIAGQQTRRAIARYQTNHSLRVTGTLTADTLEALGLRQFASE